MADLRVGPGELNLYLYRGDERSAELLLVDSDENGTPILDDDDEMIPLVLPTTGWSAQVRAKATSAATVDAIPVLMEFIVDASEAASGVIKIGWTGLDIDALPKKARWDLQNDDPAVRTYVAGDVFPGDQVTR